MFSDPEKNVSYFGLTEGNRVADFGAGSGAHSLDAVLLYNILDHENIFSVYDWNYIHISQSDKIHSLSN